MKATHQPSQKLRTIILSCALFIACAGNACSVAASTLESRLYSTDSQHRYLGKIVFTDSTDGLLVEPHLSHLSPGAHGLHIHEKPMCTNQGKAAGGHLDPYHTGKHLGPYGAGHLGDLPVLRTNKQGIANQVTIAPRLKTTDIINHSVILHQGGDNYRDQPQPLGGGGARIGCGLIQPSN